MFKKSWDISDDQSKDKDCFKDDILMKIFDEGILFELEVIDDETFKNIFIW